MEWSGVEMVLFRLMQLSCLSGDESEGGWVEWVDTKVRGGSVWTERPQMQFFEGTE